MWVRQNITPYQKKRPAKPSSDKPPASVATVNNHSGDEHHDTVATAVQQLNEDISEIESDPITVEPPKKKQKTTTQQKVRRQQNTTKTAHIITSPGTKDASAVIDMELLIFSAEQDFIVTINLIILTLLVHSTGNCILCQPNANYRPL